MIRFTWSEGASDGGMPVLDYQVWYDQGSNVNSFVLLEDLVSDTFYQTTDSLTAGIVY